MMPRFTAMRSAMAFLEAEFNHPGFEFLPATAIDRLARQHVRIWDTYNRLVAGRLRRRSHRRARR